MWQEGTNTAQHSNVKYIMYRANTKRGVSKERKSFQLCFQAHLPQFFSQHSSIFLPSNTYAASFKIFIRHHPAVPSSLISPEICSIKCRWAKTILTDGDPQTKIQVALAYRSAFSDCVPSFIHRSTIHGHGLNLIRAWRQVPYSLP